MMGFLWRRLMLIESGWLSSNGGYYVSGSGGENGGKLELEMEIV